MKFMVITFTPPKPTGLGGISSQRYSVKEVKAEDLETLMKIVEVPPHGEVHIIESNNVTTIKSELITRVLPKSSI